MDAFEQIISQLFMEDGYWTIIGYRANINQQQANTLKRGSMPRPEIDIVAYKPKEKIIYLLEVKSFLDSVGVVIKSFKDLETNFKGRYKLLTSQTYRDIVSGIVKQDLFDKGLIPEIDISVEFGLVAGNIYKGTEKDLRSLFDTNRKSKWIAWGPETILSKITTLAKKGYENNQLTMISKLINPDLKKSGAKERRKFRNAHLE